MTMQNFAIRHRFFGLLWLSTVAGCAYQIPAVQPQPTLRDVAPLAIQAESVATTSNWPSTQWWRDYNDSALTALVERALNQAPQMAGAAARVAIAAQDVRLAGAALGLKADASARTSTQRLSDNALLPSRFLGFNWYEQSDLGINLKYQFDWWGKQQAAIHSADGRARAAQAEQQAAAQAMAASVCEHYFNWQAAAHRIALLERRIALLVHGQRLAAQRASADLDASDPVTTVHSMLALEREQLAGLQGTQQLQRVALAALLATDALSFPSLDVRAFPTATTKLPANASVNLIARRADVQASRWRVESQVQDLKAVRANFYPDVSLRALAGLSSIDIGRLLRPDSAVPLVGVAVDLPLFDSSTRKLRYGRTEFELVAAIAEYDLAVIQAAQQTGTAAAELAQLHNQLQQREIQLAQAEQQLQQARRRTESGLTNLQPQLEAELSVLDKRDALLRLQHAQLLADLRLKHALGGKVTPLETKP
jgi:outer membrane protein, multidrug efflux system